MEIKINQEKFEVKENDNFWKNIDKWEPETFKIFDRFLDKRHSYLDIGAWIGPTVLYGSTLAKRVYAFEPDPVACNNLKYNLELNTEIDNVVLICSAIGPSNGTATMGVKDTLGDSMTSLLWDKENFGVNIETLKSAFLRFNILDCNFIKMDIEGGEFYALPPMKNFLKEMMPTLYLSLHSGYFENKFEYYTTIIDVLSVYPFIYTKEGGIIKLEDIIILKAFDAIIASKKVYEKEN